MRGCHLVTASCGSQAIIAKSGARVDISRESRGEWTPITVEGSPEQLRSVKDQIEKITGAKVA
jgi:hypothetical protein|eukprot:COSAG01_NODE_797_length_13523_cov_34.143027_6_plen_63_part_00